MRRLGAMLVVCTAALLGAAVTSGRGGAAPPGPAGVTPPLPLATPTITLPLPSLPPPPSIVPTLPPPQPLPLPPAPPGAIVPGPHGALPGSSGGGTAAAPPPGGQPAAATDPALAEALNGNPALVAAVDALAAQPFKETPISLRHFRLAGAATGQPGVQPGSTAARSAPLTIAAAVCFLLAVSAALAVLRRAVGPAPAAPASSRRAAARPHWRSPFGVGRLALPLGILSIVFIAASTGAGAALLARAGRTPPVAAAPRPSPPAASVVAAAPPAAPSSTTSDGSDTRPAHPVSSTTPAAAATPGPTPAKPVVDAAAQQAHAIWTQLTETEAMLAADGDRIQADETHVAQLRALLVAPGGDGVAAAAQRDRMVADLQATIGEHDRLAADYSDVLHQEYDLYRGAAGDPAVASALLAEAAAGGAPAIRDTVTYDLQVVETQLAQERSLAAAESTPAAIGAQSASGGGVFAAPLGGSLTQPFGATSFALEPPLTYNGVFYPHFHTGDDLSAPLGTPVAAAADGVVILAASSVDGKGHLVGYGNYVVIQHSGGYETLYGHLSRILVAAGKTVHRGDAIGLEGSTGWSTGPHLHFEIRHAHVPVDPLPFITAPQPPLPAPRPPAPPAP